MQAWFGARWEHAELNGSVARVQSHFILDFDKPAAANDREAKALPIGRTS